MKRLEAQEKTQKELMDMMKKQEEEKAKGLNDDLNCIFILIFLIF